MRVKLNGRVILDGEGVVSGFKFYDFEGLMLAITFGLKLLFYF